MIFINIWQTKNLFRSLFFFSSWFSGEIYWSEKMSTVTMEPLVGHYLRRSPKLYPNQKKTSHFSLNFSRRPLSGTATLRFCDYRRSRTVPIRASSTDAAVIETSEQSDVVFKETFSLKRPERVNCCIWYLFVCICIYLDICRSVHCVLYFSLEYLLDQ